MNYNFIDLTGKRFGRLVVVKLDDKITKEKRRCYWICKCDCGNIKTILGDHLKYNRTKSCGCLNRELTIQRNTKSNRIEFDSNLGCFRVYFNNCDEYFLCDIEDRDIAEKYTWYKDSYGYAVSINKKYSLKFHRLIMSKYYNIDGLVIDHINHNTLDNRKYNLRVCTYSENKRNSRPSSNTGEKFICYDKICNKYIFQIAIYNNKTTRRFNTLEEAISFRDNYLKEHPNDFYYNPDGDYRNKNNPNVIQPFTFIHEY